jgi:hypothetical protein
MEHTWGALGIVFTQCSEFRDNSTFASGTWEKSFHSPPERSSDQVLAGVSPEWATARTVLVRPGESRGSTCLQDISSEFFNRK